jgi:hypothetical protein
MTTPLGVGFRFKPNPSFFFADPGSEESQEYELCRSTTPQNGESGVSRMANSSKLKIFITIPYGKQVSIFGSFEHEQAGAFRRCTNLQSALCVSGLFPSNEK